MSKRQPLHLFPEKSHNLCATQTTSKHYALITLPGAPSIKQTIQLNRHLTNKINMITNNYTPYPEDYYEPFTPANNNIYLYDYNNIDEAQYAECFHTFFIVEEYNDQEDPCFLDQLAV